MTTTFTWPAAPTLTADDILNTVSKSGSGSTADTFMSTATLDITLVGTELITDTMVDAAVAWAGDALNTNAGSGCAD